MTIEEAIEVLKRKYEQVKDNPQINDPVTWALYRTWRISDGEKKKSINKGMTEDLVR